MDKLPGCIYQNKNRWWWRVRLPGEDRLTSRPLIATGAKFATSDRRVAEEIAKAILSRCVARDAAGEKKTFDGSVGGLVACYCQYARQRYRHADGTPTTKAYCTPFAFRDLLELFAALPVDDFGPLRLQQVRDAMLVRPTGKNGPDGKPIVGLARKTINQHVETIRRMFKWAAGQQMIHESTWRALTAVEGLRAGMLGARETAPVRPVSEEIVRATLPYMPPTLAAMVQVQMLTGQRPGELVQMRPCDIDMTGPVWIYRPAAHKTAHHGHKRTIAIGPKAQEILRPYLDRRLDAYCFSPAEVVAERNADAHAKRKTPMSCGNKPGSNRVDDPQIRPGDKYDTQSYGRSVTYAISAANKDISAKNAGDSGLKLAPIPRWSPHQLRHAMATKLRREYGDAGLDVARAALGHKSLGMADHYAELDLRLAVEAAKRLG